MKKQEIQEIIDCLGSERKIFRYHEGRYALDYLGFEMQNRGVASLSIADLKRGQLSSLVEKSVIKNLLAHCGAGVIDKAHLDSCWENKHFCWVLGMGIWGCGRVGLDQTSRRQSNLVLQLNFTQHHCQRYQKLIRPCNSLGPFEYRGHPINTVGRKTMAWVRLDFDFDTGEALIEEIQNDWLRRAKYWSQRVRLAEQQNGGKLPLSITRNFGASVKEFETYMGELAAYEKIWAEASLAAAIDFIRQQLGLTTIYYHSFKTGCQVKNIYCQPPKSMYASLPKKFLFKAIEQAPMFLLNDKGVARRLKKIACQQWFQLRV